jgi:hypothetical protein
MLMLLFAGSNLDLSLGPLSKTPTKPGLILGIVAVLLTLAAVSLIMYDLSAIHALQFAAQMFSHLGGGKEPEGMGGLSVISKLSYVWVMLWGQGTFCTVMGILASKVKPEQEQPLAPV